MADDNRTVITGMGCVTACGGNVATTWESVVSGQSGIAPVVNFEAAEWPYAMAGELKEFNVRKAAPDRKLVKVTTRQDIIGLQAVTQALEHSDVLNYREGLDDATLFNERTGVYVGAPSIKYQQHYDYLEALAGAKGDRRLFGEGAMESVHPMWLLRSLPNNVLAYTGIYYGFKGANQNITAHAASGVQAIAEARRAIEDGQIDRAIVVGYDAATEPEALPYYAAMGLLSPSGLRPFDAERDGTILGEGAGAIILESARSADERGATVRAEVQGCSVVSEARGILSISEDGEGLSRAMREALGDAKIEQDQIGMITAHGNGTRGSDASEARAIVGTFGDAPVASFKWALGHTIAASGVIETILSLVCLREGRIPGIAALEQLGDDCAGLNASPLESTPRKGTALVVTRAFAGLNACLVLAADAD